MKYDIIPSFYVLFKNDEFVLPEYPGCNELAYALSFFGYLYTEKDTMNKTFFEESIGVIGTDVDTAKEYLNNKVLITEYGVLAAWKTIFKVTKRYPVYNYQRLDIYFNFLYRLIVKEQEEYLKDFEDISIKNSIMTNSLLGYLDNLSFEFIRSYYLFIKNKDKFLNFKGYSEIFEKFYEEYKLDIYDYLQALYVLIFCKCENNYRNLRNSHNLRDNNFVISKNEIKNEETKNKVEQALKILSFDYTEASEWTKEKCENRLDFSLFQEKPLYKVNNDFYVPTTRKYLQDQFFYSLIYKMRKLYPEKNKSFFNLIGKIFEDYLKYVFGLVIKLGEIEYKIIPEFTYGTKRNSKASPDLIICWEDDVYVFEYKAARVLNSVYKLNNEVELEESIKKVVNIPISQSINRMNEIICGNLKDEIDDKKNYYFIAVTMNNFPTHYSTFDSLKEQIEKVSFKICGVYNICVEEYELLCDATIKQKKPLGFFLNEFKYKYPKYYSFKNYIKRYTTGTKSVLFSEFEKDLQDFTGNIEL